MVGGLDWIILDIFLRQISIFSHSFDLSDCQDVCVCTRCDVMIIMAMMMAMIFFIKLIKRNRVYFVATWFFGKEKKRSREKLNLI